MTNYNDVYPSKYLKAADLDGGRHEVVINVCKRDLVGHPPDDKLVITLDEFTKRFILNKINAKTIASIAGTDDYTAWAGTRVVLYPTRVEFSGELRDTIRIDNPAPRQASRNTSSQKDEPKPAPAVETQVNETPLTLEDVPF